MLVVVGVLAPVAGVGLLYLLWRAGAADVGPQSAGALPLQQLDGTDAQPLARMMLAWLPIGLAAGAASATFTRSTRAVGVGAIGIVSGAVLVLSGAGSDAIANNERFSQQLTTPLAAAGTWVSLALLIIGAGAGAWAAGRALRAPSAA